MAISRNLSLFCGTPEGTRTPNIQNRNLTLYPIELRTLVLNYYSKSHWFCKALSGILFSEGGISAALRTDL